MRLLITNYTFNAAAKTIAFDDYVSIELERVLQVENKTRGVTYYDPESSSTLGTVATNILTFTASTSGHANGDDLEIWYEGDNPLTATELAAANIAKETGGNLAFLAATDFATSAKQDTINTNLTNIRSDTTELLTRVPDMGTANMIASTPVTIAADDTQISGVNTALQDILVELAQKFETSDIATLVAQLNPVQVSSLPVGSAAMAASTPVTIATNDTQLSGVNSKLTNVDSQTAASQTALQIMDDWDESDRAKVNPIVGQAGVQGGSGTVSANTQRVVLATDVGLPAGTAVLGQTYGSFRSTKALTNENVSFSSSGENTIVSGTASQTIRVFRLSLTIAGATALTIKDAAGGNTLATYTFQGAGALDLQANDGEPYFLTATAGAFVISSSNAVSVTGNCQYIKSA